MLSFAGHFPSFFGNSYPSGLNKCFVVVVVVVFKEGFKALTGCSVFWFPDLFSPLSLYTLTRLSVQETLEEVHPILPMAAWRFCFFFLFGLAGQVAGVNHNVLSLVFFEVTLTLV